MTHVIPKRKVEVEVHLATGGSRKGRVFLDYIDVIHRGEQTLLDKFNDEFAWFAIGENLDSGGVEIVNRDHVVTVEPGSEVSKELVHKETSPVFRRERVTLRLIGGRELSGQIAMDLPDEFSRVSDFLNFPQNFFAVETEAGPVLVSKQHLLSLTPHERPPLAPGSRRPEVGERA